MLYYIRKGLSEHPSETHRCAVLDSFWSDPYRGQYANHVVEGKKVNPRPARVCQYFKGELPELYGVKWDDVDYLYAPYFVNGNHWVALQVDLVNWMVNVYDCNIPLVTEAKMELEVKPVLKFLPVYMRLHEPLAKKYASSLGNDLGYHRVQTIKQNLRGLVLRMY
jgi:hypothetical protein